MLSERFDTVAETAGPHRRPLPAVLTPTIGREAEIATVVDLLDGPDRLVTLTGPGGVGKTRLALEVAHARRDLARETVHFVPLAAVTDPDLVMSTVADQLGAREITGLRPVEWLAAHFGSSPAVLVLDNLEQALAAAPEVAELVERSPGLKVLATSRHPLRVRGEREIVVGPLATPDDDDTVTLVAQVPAVRLLVDRAQAAGGRFELTDVNAAAVALLSRRLGGLPLALELVAARLRLLTPDQLLQRLGTSLDVTGGAADLPQRQRTLRATLDWSQELLTTEERTLFARLGVFAGGATLEAIESVCADTGSDVLEALAGLLDNSLVVTDRAPTGDEPRFRMLEPVAEYARECLSRSGKEEAIRLRHLSHFSRLGRMAQPFLCGPYQREWSARVDAERPNVRIAIESGFATGHLSDVLRLVWDTLVYFYIRDGMDEPRRWVRRLAADRSGFDVTEQALLDVAMAVVGEPPADRDVATTLTGAVETLLAGGQRLEAAVAQHHRGVWLWIADDQQSGIRALEEASRSYSALDHDWGVATVETTLGAVHAALGNQARALSHHQRSLDHARRINNRPQMAQALQGLALVNVREGRAAEAGAQLAEAVAIVLSDRMTTVATYCLEALAGLALLRDDAWEAVRMISAARSTRRRLSIPEWTAAAGAAEPLLTRARDLLSGDAFAQAWREGAADDVFAMLGAAQELDADVVS